MFQDAVLSIMKHYYTVVAIVRNESNYLAEWIKHNLDEGADRIQIYHNADPIDDDEETREELNRLSLLYPTEVSGVIPWPRYPGQFSAYDHFLQVRGHGTEWAAFVDADEYLFTKNEIPTVSEFLKQKQFETVPGLAVKWHLFGSNGLATRDIKTRVVQDFTMRAAEVNPHCKSIVRPRLTKSVGKDPHYFLFKDGKFAVNEYGVNLPLEYGVMEGGTCDRIVCNHYHTKSRIEYVDRKAGNFDVGSGRQYGLQRTNEMFKAHDLNEVSDFHLRDKQLARNK